MHRKMVNNEDHIISKVPTINFGVSITSELFPNILQENERTVNWPKMVTSVSKLVEMDILTTLIGSTDPALSAA